MFLFNNDGQVGYHFIGVDLAEYCRDNGCVEPFHKFTDNTYFTIKASPKR